MLSLSIRSGISGILILGVLCSLASGEVRAVTKLVTEVKKPRVIPHPQFQSSTNSAIQFDVKAKPAAGLFWVDHFSSGIQLATELIRGESQRLSRDRRVFEVVQFRKALHNNGNLPGIYLVDWSQESGLKNQVRAILDEEDRQVLSDLQKTGQGYVIRTLPERRAIWLVGATDQGVLYAATTLLQLIEPRDSGISIAGVHIRDFPDFRYRAASDWLLQAEANRWAYDWGDGRRAYVRRVKQKLDLCLRFKINMVVFDGFGFTEEKVPGYAQMMKELNGYARDRKIKLLFGGYGSNYQAALIRPEHNIGKIWYNRENYPSGMTYSCFGEANLTYRENSPTGGFLGTCRGNDELNRLKAEEIEQFVRSVQPGALYIHHEDVGNVVRMGNPDDANNRLSDWKSRCPRCRAKWQNDDFFAKDGGAGAIAHGYKNFMNAIFSVKDPDTGYDASKDCTVVFISPGYSPNPTDPKSWEKHLLFWSNVVSLLPKNENVEIGFREVLPQEVTGKRWIDAYKERLQSEGLNMPIFNFFLGGADLYTRDSFNYPFSGAAAMNGLFLGAETSYNFSGAVFQDPLQLFNSEFSWNVKSPGHQIPKSYEESVKVRMELMTYRQIPAEIIGPSGFLEEACKKLYGRKAGMAMKRYFEFYRMQPLASTSSLLVPDLPERLYPLPILWRSLEIDRDYGSLGPVHAPGPSKDRADSPFEKQERWAKIWKLYGEVNYEAVGMISEVLGTNDLRADAHDEIMYLKKCLEVAQRISFVLASYHTALMHTAARDRSSVESSVKQTQDRLKELLKFLNERFSFDTVDPMGGDQSSWLEASLYLRSRLDEILRMN